MLFRALFCIFVNGKIGIVMSKIGDLCPLFFGPLKDRFSMSCDYVQTFYTTDIIQVQIFSESSPSVKLIPYDGECQSVTLKEYLHNEDVTMYYSSISNLEDGIYVLSVDGEESEPFCVTSDKSILERTTLIRYSHKDNNSVFDNIFWIGDKQVVFEWRVEAGFKTGGFSAKIDNEQYRNQFQEITEMYAMPYETYTLTIGDATGVPYWYVRHLNRIFCLSNVEISGKSWVRSESSVPEMTAVLEGASTYNATLILEPKENEVSGIGGMPESATASSVVGFAITDPTDGQMLQYSEEESAFVNVTTVEV